MKSSTVVAILVLQAVLLMGILPEVNAAGAGYFPKCCDKCNSWSGFVFCDDAKAKCHPDCANCVVVQEHPPKTYRCGDGQDSISTPCPPPCKKY